MRIVNLLAAMSMLKAKSCIKIMRTIGITSQTKACEEYLQAETMQKVLI